LQYPKWLDDNKTTVKEDEYNRYVQQYELMKQVCTELQAEGDADPEDVKKERFSKILDLMQKVRERDTNVDQ